MNDASSGTPIRVSDWEEVFRPENRAPIEALLPAYLPARRWFGGKARRIESVRIEEAIPLSGTSSRAYLTLINVAYSQGASQTYVLPLTFAYGQEAARLRETAPGAVLTSLRVFRSDEDLEGGPDVLEGVLYDAVWDKEFAISLFEAIRYARSFDASSGEIRAWPTEELERIAGEEGSWNLEPNVVGAEQSNTSVIYGDRFILKMFRRLEEGTSPDLEIGRFLGERGFTHTPPLAGAIEHHRGKSEPVTLAILQGFVPNRGDAWNYTLESLDAYYFRFQVPDAQTESRNPEIGTYLDSARLLGRRTAEMHLALAAGSSEPAFAPEPFTTEYGRELYQSVQGLVQQAFGQLRDRLDRLPAAVQMQGREVLGKEGAILARFESLLTHRFEALLTRCHGDYHLGQVLWTGNDFYIIDFEGEPVRSLAERRKKHSPLKDVAGMLRSFHYAANAALFAATDSGKVQPNDISRMESLAAGWNDSVGNAYLAEYLTLADEADFLLQSRNDLRVLLDTYILEKAVYELIYELNNRPDWVRIPLQGIAELAG